MPRLSNTEAPGSTLCSSESGRCGICAISSDLTVGLKKNNYGIKIGSRLTCTSSEKDLLDDAYTPDTEALLIQFPAMLPVGKYWFITIEQPSSMRVLTYTEKRRPNKSWQTVLSTLMTGLAAVHQQRTGDGSWHRWSYKSARHYQHSIFSIWLYLKSSRLLRVIDPKGRSSTSSYAWSGFQALALVRPDRRGGKELKRSARSS